VQTIGLAILAYAERRQTLELIKRLDPLIDDFVVGVDNRNIDGLKNTLVERGKKTYLFDVKEGFSVARNIGLRMLKTDWIIVLAPDEDLFIEDQVKLIQIVKAAPAKVDGYSLPRRHWRDLEMTKEWKYPYPDRHIKLFRNRSSIHYTGMVHEMIIGCKHRIKLNIDVHHFNMYHDRVKRNRKEKEELYQYLIAEQKRREQAGVKGL